MRPRTPRGAAMPARPALQRAVGYVAFDPTNCAGCSTCMAVCSLFHDGVVNPSLARLQVVAPVLKTFEVTGQTCRQCDSPECLYACSNGALHVDPETGARVINPATCTGCRLCIGACVLYPNSPIRYDAASRTCVKCDLCGGDPQCVRLCPKSVSLTAHLYPRRARVLKFIRKRSL